VLSQVPQTGPACCAASTAGAWNAVLRTPRGTPGALNQRLVLDVLDGLLARQCDRAAWLLRKQTQVDLAPLEAAVEKELEVRHTRLGDLEKSEVVDLVVPLLRELYPKVCLGGGSWLGWGVSKCILLDTD
jgi:hypothetical protein